MTGLAIGTAGAGDLGLGALLRWAAELIAPRPAPEKKWAERLDAVDPDGRFCGYASLFGRMDFSGDVVMPGAFARSLRSRGAGGVGMLLEHDPKAPIGAWTRVEEDRFGLWVEGRLTPCADAVRASRAMRGGLLDGLSIGFRTVRAEEDRSARVRRLTEIDLWEVSVVRSPMLPEARARAHGDRLGRDASQGVGRAGAGMGPGCADDAGLIARMRRGAANMLATR